MINIPRTVLRDCRAVFRRACTHPTVSRSALVHIVSDKHGTRIRFQTEDISIEYQHPTPTESASFMLPMELMTDCEGKDGVVQFQVMKSGNVEVYWDHAGVPHRREYANGQAKAKSFPGCPDKCIPNDPKLLRALDHAMQTIGNDTVHRGINFLQLRGAQGDIVASDGRQLLIQRGYQWPFKEPVLVPRTGVFGSRELPQGSLVMIAFAKEHVVFRIGPWTIALRIETSARYPNVDTLIPRAEQAVARLNIDPDDAEALRWLLPNLPAAKEHDSPVTVDLKGSVAIRAKAEEETRCTEVTLQRSRSEGSATRIATNRRYLQRALELGFGRLFVFDAGKPVVCQDDRRTFVWVPLSPDNAIGPQRSPIRMSLDGEKVQATRSNRSHVAPVSSRSSPTPTHQKPPSEWGLVAAARNLWAFMHRVRRQHEQV